MKETCQKDTMDIGQSVRVPEEKISDKFSEREPNTVPYPWECESNAYAEVHSSRRCLGTFWWSLSGDQEGPPLLSCGNRTRTAMITELTDSY